MPAWSAFAADAPELAAEVRRRFDARVHKTLATLRADGSPRISGTEATFADGELWIGSMLGARKVDDLVRDARFALHGGSEDPPGWDGDAKVAGLAVEVTDPEALRRLIGVTGEPPGPARFFRLDLRDVSTVGLSEGKDALRIAVWTPDGGVRTIERTG